MFASMNQRQFAVAKKSQDIDRKGPERANVPRATFLPVEVKRSIYAAFHEHQRSVQKLSRDNRLPHAVIEEVLRAGRDKEVGRYRSLGRAA